MPGHNIFYLWNMSNCQLHVLEMLPTFCLRTEYNNCVTRISMRTDGKGKPIEQFTTRAEEVRTFAKGLKVALPGDCRGQFEELTMCQDPPCIGSKSLHVLSMMKHVFEKLTKLLGTRNAFHLLWASSFMQLEHLWRWFEGGLKILVQNLRMWI